mmetsp:Transcript_29157/g.43930  ORF Transcript_29157/g.43930 Transcript_29157/m.43930 type:complete len:217 (+) Transcript_29157:72-722(+)
MPSTKSSCLTWVPPLLRAHMPASTVMAFTWAPLKSGELRATSSKLTSSVFTFIFLEWIFRILTLASSFGWGNSTFLSRRPDLRRAGSRMSGLLVAAITLMSSCWEKPSSWFSSSSMVLCTSLVSPSPAPLLVPMASSSSMKMMAGAFSLAMSKASLIILAPSPMYIWTSWGPANLRKVALVWAAQALAMRVLPVPGGPWRRRPLGGLIPMFSKRSL